MRVFPLIAPETLLRALPARGGGIGCLLLAGFLAALPGGVVAQQAPSVSIEFDQSPGVEEGKTATFTVTRSGDTSKAWTVNYAFIQGGGNQVGPGEGEAVAGTDYTGAINTLYPLTFPANSSSEKISVPTIEDNVYEPREYFRVRVSGDYTDDEGNIIAIGERVALARITEDDERYLTFEPVTFPDGQTLPEFEAEEGGMNGLTIKLNETLPYALKLTYTTGNTPHTTATKDDYKMEQDKEVTIPVNTSSVVVDLNITDDKLVEPDEYFTISFFVDGKANPTTVTQTYNQVNFKEGRSDLSVLIKDNDSGQGVVYLRGPARGGLLPGYPVTRNTLTEGQRTTIYADITGDAPSTDITIPLDFEYYPENEAERTDFTISPDYVTIPANQTTGSVTLSIRDDTDDERYRELLVVKIDEDAMKLPTGYSKGDRDRFEVVMLDNDRTGVKLLGPTPSDGALTEASSRNKATFQIQMDRSPKKTAPANSPFSGDDVDVQEGAPTFKLGYGGAAKKATLGRDFTSPDEVESGSCSTTTDGKLTCTVTLNVINDNLYEGGSGTTENVTIMLKGAEWDNNDGITTVPRKSC